MLLCRLTESIYISPCLDLFEVKVRCVCTDYGRLSSYQYRPTYCWSTTRIICYLYRVIIECEFIECCVALYGIFPYNISSDLLQVRFVSRNELKYCCMGAKILSSSITDETLIKWVTTKYHKSEYWFRKNHIKK